MAEVNYRDLKKYLTVLKVSPQENPPSPVYLIHGEELLYKTALERLLKILIPLPDRSLHYEPVEGNQENIHDAVEKVNTFSLLSNLKVVALLDTKIFYSAKDTGNLLEKAKERYEAHDVKKAAEYALGLLGLLTLGYEDISPVEPLKSLKLDLSGSGDTSWLNKIINYCRDNQLPIPESRDHTDLLRQAIEKGFPKGNYLIITTDMVDKRRSLYQTIRKRGTIIDCSVPRGERRADRQVQEAVLTEQMSMLLAKSKKSIDRLAQSALMEMTGFDLRTFSNNVEKLISYVGERKEITSDDVASVLERTKKDPIYELTGAVTDRNVEKSLFFLQSLRNDNIHPLQILAALSNQIRRLLIVKDFVQGAYGSGWQRDISFERFKKNVLPALQAYDDSNLELLSKGEAGIDLKNKQQSETGRPFKSDLTFVKIRKNPYPIFLILQKAENYTRNELMTAMETLHQTDLQIKSSALDSRLVLEKMIFSICRKKSYPN